MNHLITALRPKHSVKNLFVFLPLVFGMKIFSYPENLNTLLAFVYFSLASSAVYLLNDVFDAEKDRLHPKKKLRPIAAGEISVSTALTACAVLAAASLILSYSLNRELAAVLAAYLALNFVYSRFLKHRVIVDVFCIGAFFLLRLQAGSAVSGVTLSHWILFMTFLLALFLGFSKRRQELKLAEEAPSRRKVLLQYHPYFIDQMISVITSSIVVVYMLYTVDPATVSRFGTTHLIYSIPFVYYGIFRYLYLIHKAGEDGDPTNMLLTDKRMQFNLFLWIIVCIAVIYFGL